MKKKVDEFELDSNRYLEHEKVRALLLIARELKRRNDIEKADRLMGDEDAYLAYRAEGWDE